MSIATSVLQYTFYTIYIKNAYTHTHIYITLHLLTDALVAHLALLDPLVRGQVTRYEGQDGAVYS